MAPQLVPTTFEYFANRTHKSVLIKGSWDRWQSFAALHRREDNSNLWQVHMTLSPGTILFKFVVDNEWVCAPNYEHISDGFGGMNCALDIKPPNKDETTASNTQGNDQPADPGHCPPSTRASITEVTGVGFDNHHQHEHDPSVHDLPRKFPSNSSEPSATQQELAHEEGRTNGSGIQSERETEVAQPMDLKPQTTVVTIQHPCDRHYKRVSVKGSWDGWKKISPLELSKEHDAWHAVLDLPVGNFLFKFIVDDHWTHCVQYEIQSDDFGGWNNVINVSASDSPERDASKPLDKLHSTKQPQENVPDTQTLSIHEKEDSSCAKEDVHPVEGQSACDDEDITRASAVPRAQDTAAGQCAAKQVCETQTAPEDAVMDSEKLEETEVAVYASEVHEKLGTGEESPNTGAYQAPKADASEAEETNGTVGTKPETKFERCIPVKDADSSSNGQEETDQRTELSEESLSHEADNHEDKMEDERSKIKKENKDERGCIIC